MGLITFTIRNGVRYGILGSAVYYTKQEGVWSTAKDSEVIVAKLLTLVPSDRKDIVMKQIPSTACISGTFWNGWNKGVMVTVDTLLSLPTLVAKYSVIGYLKIESLVKENVA